MESRWTAAVVGVVVALLGLAVWQIVAEKQTPRDQQTSSVGEAASFPNQTGGKLSASPTNPMTAPAPRDAASTSKPTPSSIAPPPFAPPDEAAMIEVDKVSLMIRDYRTIADENPVGTNAEIMAAVMGGNRRQAKLGPPEGMQ